MDSKIEHGSEAQKQKGYHSPELTTYGDIREITQNAGGIRGMNDGGAGNDKTGF